MTFRFKECMVVAVLCLLGCDSEPVAPRRDAAGGNPWQSVVVRPSSPGLSMPERLNLVANLANSAKNQYLSADRVPIQEEALAKAVGFKQKSYYHQEYAKDLLNSGQSEAAFGAFQAMERYLAEANPSFLEEHRIWMLRKQAICLLRLGEQENCIANHGRHSCLFPITGDGVHSVTRGSEGAIEKLTELLQIDPDNRQAQWLLNLAYMTLGTYPEAVPAAYRVPSSVFASEYEIPTFPNVAPALGVDTLGLSGGSIMEDFNGDGLLDLMCSGLGLREPLRLFLNRGVEGFEDVSERAGLAGIVGGLNLLQTDYNNDGHVDVFVLRGGWFASQGHHPNSLLRNEGDGTFSDVTEEARLLSLHPTQTAVWFDFDLDGYLDLFIGNETTRDDPHPCELYRNNGDGTFMEMASRCGVGISGMVKGVTVGTTTMMVDRISISRVADNRILSFGMTVRLI